MNAKIFSAEVEMVENSAVIKFHGDINALADDGMTEAYAKTENNGIQSVTLDFEHVDYINSTGIALIVGLLAKARMSKVNIRAIGLTDHYREIFTITRLSDFMELG